MRVAVVDIGTNSTRLLVADFDAAGALTELHRASTVTRLGDRVDASGRLAGDAMERVFATLATYRAVIDAHAVAREATTAVLTSAVRDAANGPGFTAQVRERFGIDARTIDGDEEAALTFAGATSERPRNGTEVVVVDIGGGSTEFVVGTHAAGIAFHVSTQAGVVRQTERHLHADPPPPEAMRLLAAETERLFMDAIPLELRERVTTAIAVAGTPTSCAAIELGLDPYDPSRTHGHRLELGVCELQLARLAVMTEDERREVTGLHPDRAPTIVAGVAMLIEAMRVFGLEHVEVSEHDLLRGAALGLAQGGSAGSAVQYQKHTQKMDVCPTQVPNGPVRYRDCR